MYVNRQEAESRDCVASIHVILLRPQKVSVSIFGQHTRCNKDFNFVLSTSRQITV